MKTRTQSWILLSLFLLASCGVTKNTTSKDIRTTKYQMILDSIYQANPKSVGLMVHIESPEKGISWSGSAGYADAKNKIPVTPDQPALIASSIKTYISATMLRLVELKLVSIDDPIKQHLSKQTVELFESDGYDFDRIKIKHLLSHTSGIQDYANTDYLDWIDKNQKHRWTRDEQLRLAVKVGNPLGSPQDVFSYADANFLLCTEIIGNITKKPFYEAIRELLRYEELKLKNTWFPTLETKNIETKPLVHQYWGERNWDSYDHDISWDLYGGGGIATTTKELAQFSYFLFNGKIIKDQEVFNKIFTKLIPKDGKDNGYRLGLVEGTEREFKTYGHGGFWGTTVNYIPELNASISVYVLERDERKLRANILDAFVHALSKDK